MVDWQNGFEATLSDRVLLADTYIKMSPVPTPSEGRLVLEDTSRDNYEVIYYTSKDANGVYTTAGGARNEDGNSSGVHAKGARVRMNITAQDMREIRDHSQNIANEYSALPTGTVLPFVGATAPSLFLIADGSAVSRTTYAALFALMGVAYGAGDGSTTFNLPNLKGRSIFGLDSAQTEFNSIGKSGGQKTVGAHSHNLDGFMPNSTNALVLNDRNGDKLLISDNAAHGSNGENKTNWGGGVRSDGSGISGVNNLNPYLTMNFIVRT